MEVYFSEFTMKLYGQLSDKRLWSAFHPPPTI